MNDIRTLKCNTNIVNWREKCMISKVTKMTTKYVGLTENSNIKVL